MKKWEYLRKKDLHPFEMNELGKEGWELVNFSIRQYKSVNDEFVFYFKREVES